MGTAGPSSLPYWKTNIEQVGIWMEEFGEHHRDSAGEMAPKDEKARFANLKVMLDEAGEDLRAGATESATSKLRGVGESPLFNGACEPGLFEAFPATLSLYLEVAERAVAKGIVQPSDPLMVDLWAELRWARSNYEKGNLSFAQYLSNAEKRMGELSTRIRDSTPRGKESSAIPADATPSPTVTSVPPEPSANSSEIAQGFWKEDHREAIELLALAQRTHRQEQGRAGVLGSEKVGRWRKSIQGHLSEAESLAAKGKFEEAWHLVSDLKSDDIVLALAGYQAPNLFRAELADARMELTAAVADGRLTAGSRATDEISALLDEAGKRFDSRGLAYESLLERGKNLISLNPEFPAPPPSNNRNSHQMPLWQYLALAALAGAAGGAGITRYAIRREPRVAAGPQPEGLEVSVARVEDGGDIVQW